MKPISTLTGVENVLALIQNDNPSATINSSQVELTTPIDTEGRSYVTVTAVTDAGFSGEITVDYVRNLMSNYITEDSFIILDGTETTTEALEALAAQYDLVLDDIVASGVTIPGTESNQVVIITLTSSAGYVYNTGEEKQAVLSTVDLSENVRGGDTGLLRITTTGLVRGYYFKIPSVLFYGGNSSGYTNTITRIAEDGTLAADEITIGTARQLLSGVGINSTGLFYGGSNANDVTNIVTRLAGSGVLLSDETNVGTARYRMGSAAPGIYGLFYGGFGFYTGTYTNKMTVIQETGVIQGAETTIGTERTALAGSAIGTIGVFYAGIWGSTSYRTVTRTSQTGTIFGGETLVGTARSALAGTTINETAIFYGGAVGASYYSTVTRIDQNGSIVGSEANVDTARRYLTGGVVNTTAIFYGGSSGSTLYYNIVTRINESGAQIGTDTNIGTGNFGSGAASGLTT